MLDQSRHSGVHRSHRLHAGFCVRCKSVLGPHWFAYLLVEVMHAVVYVQRYSLSFISPCVFSLGGTVGAAGVSVSLLSTSCCLGYQFLQFLLHQLCDRCNLRVWILGKLRGEALIGDESVACTILVHCQPQWSI